MDTIRDSFLALWNDIQHEFAGHTTRLLFIVLLLIGARVVSGRLSDVIARGLSRTSVDTHGVFLLRRLSTWIVWFVAGFWILSVFGIDLTALAATLGIVTLAVSLALQDLIKNFVAGLYLLIERPYRIGQTIKVKEFEGTVEEVKMRVTVLRKPNNTTILVPNAILFAEAVINRGQPAEEQPLQRPPDTP